MENRSLGEDITAGLGDYLTQKEQEYSRELSEARSHVVMLNSHVQYVNTIPGESVEYLYTLGGNGNTIIMQMRHDTNLHPEAVKKLVDIGENLSMTLAKRYKWDSWVNIETKLDPTDRPTQKSKTEN